MSIFNTEISVGTMACLVRLDNREKFCRDETCLVRLLNRKLTFRQVNRVR